MWHAKALDTSYLRYYCELFVWVFLLAQYQPSYIVDDQPSCYQQKLGNLLEQHGWFKLFHSYHLRGKLSTDFFSPTSFFKYASANRDNGLVRFFIDFSQDNLMLPCTSRYVIQYFLAVLLIRGRSQLSMKNAFVAIRLHGPSVSSLISVVDDTLPRATLTTTLARFAGLNTSPATPTIHQPV